MKLEAIYLTRLVLEGMAILPGFAGWCLGLLGTISRNEYRKQHFLLFLAFWVLVPLSRLSSNLSLSLFVLCSIPLLTCIIGGVLLQVRWFNRNGKI